ncbi:MAG: Carboxyl-terminal protease [Pseudomonadota bacterium]
MNSPRVLLLSGVVAGVLAGVALARWVFFVESDDPVLATPITAPPNAAAPPTGAASTLTQQLSAAELRRLTEVFAQVQREYVDEVPDDKLVDSAVRGMLSGLDAHSAYLDRREFEDIRRGAAGNYPGIGIEVSAENGFIKVQRPLEDSPAARAGIRAGDLILRIDGEPIGVNVADAIEQMRGPAGSLVRLTVICVSPRSAIRHQPISERLSSVYAENFPSLRGSSSICATTLAGYSRVLWRSPTRCSIRATSSSREAAQPMRAFEWMRSRGRC